MSIRVHSLTSPRGFDGVKPTRGIVLGNSSCLSPASRILETITTSPPWDFLDVRRKQRRLFHQLPSQANLTWSHPP